MYWRRHGRSDDYRKSLIEGITLLKKKTVRMDSLFFYQFIYVNFDISILSNDWFTISGMESIAFSISAKEG